MNKWDKSYPSKAKRERIKADRAKGMTLQELVNKYGGSVGGMQKICAKEAK